MLSWWNHLDLFSRIYACIAIPATLALIVQTVLLFIGGQDDGCDGAECDCDDIVGGHEGDGLTLFSVRGIMAMLAIGGWSGLALYESGVAMPLTIALSFLAGSAALVGLAYLMRAVMRLQSNGVIDKSGAIGKTGQVYLPIPPAAKGRGKIHLTLQERYIEADAVTAADRRIETGETVRIISSDEAGLLVVEPITK